MQHHYRRLKIFEFDLSTEYLIKFYSADLIKFKSSFREVILHTHYFLFLLFVRLHISNVYEWILNAYNHFR